MKESGMNGVTVHGRLSSVAWLEHPPYNGKKEKDGKFWCYHLGLLSDGALEILERDLEDMEKVWVKSFPQMEWEAPHPAFAGYAQALKENPRLQRQLMTGGLHFAEPDHDECLDFCLRQLQKLYGQLEARGRKSEAQEVMAIHDDIESREGDAYAEHKARLIELNTKR